jgi:hypothetical protein
LVWLFLERVLPFGLFLFRTEYGVFGEFKGREKLLILLLLLENGVLLLLLLLFELW